MSGKNYSRTDRIKHFLKQSPKQSVTNLSYSHSIPSAIYMHLKLLSALLRILQMWTFQVAEYMYSTYKDKHESPPPIRLQGNENEVRSSSICHMGLPESKSLAVGSKKRLGWLNPPGRSIHTHSRDKWNQWDAAASDPSLGPLSPQETGWSRFTQCRFCSNKGWIH